MFKTGALRSVPVRGASRRRAHPLPALLFLAFAGSPAGAAELWLSPDTGQLAFAGKGGTAASFVDQLSFNGSTIRAGDLVAGVREYFVAGNFDVLATDVVRLAPGASSSGVRFIVGNNASILGRVDVSGRSTGEKSGGGGGGGAGGLSQYSEVLNNNAGTGGAGGVNGTLTSPFGNVTPVTTPIGGMIGAGTDAFFVTTDVGATWININDPGITGLGKGGSGSAGAVGGAGSSGRDGLFGLAGGAGSRGLNDTSSRFARGGQGGFGGSGNPVVGLGGAGGTGGAGGSGAALSFDTFLSDAAKAGFRTSTAATNGARGADGGNGTAGAKGLTGQKGSDGNAAPGVRRVGDGLTVTPEQAVLVGGWGGGGGAGGQGSQGSGGGGGGGGGAGGGGGGAQKCPSAVIIMCGIPGAVVGTVLALGEQSTYLVGTDPGPTVGGPGGVGGAGGGSAAGAIGGMGGVGAPGTNGGGGGGVVEINARGRVLVGGVVSAEGGSGGVALWPGLPGSGGGASGVGSQGGATLRGAVGGAGGGGSGGSGGLSGLGGNGGDGGAAGIGAGGGGGTVKLIGTQVLVADGGQVTVQGGGGSSPGSRGARGDIYVGSNDSGLTDVAGQGRRIVDPTGANTGARSENMYRYDNKARTAYIPDVLGEYKGSSIGLAGGAEVFGLLEGRGPDGQSLMSNLVRQAGADAPAGAVAAVWRIDSVDLGSFQTMAFASSDLVFFVNLGNTALKNPAFVSRAEDQAQRIGFVRQLYQGGWARSYPFGSGEDSLIETLAPGQVWVTTVEKGSARRFDFEADGLASYDNLLGQNQRAFLIAAAPVPEVGKAAMWLSGLSLLLMLGRRRNGVRTLV